MCNTHIVYFWSSSKQPVWHQFHSGMSHHWFCHLKFHWVIKSWPSGLPPRMHYPSGCQPMGPGFESWRGTEKIPPSLFFLATLVALVSKPHAGFKVLLFDGGCADRVISSNNEYCIYGRKWLSGQMFDKSFLSTMVIILFVYQGNTIDHLGYWAVHVCPTKSWTRRFQE